MSFEISKAMKYVESALNARAIRQDLISSNIANVDTPYYKPKDINFEDALTQRANEEFGGQKPKKLELAITDSKMMQASDSNELEPTIFFRDGHLARNDGNSVDLDVETTELSKNNVMYNALIETFKKDASIFRAVLTSSKNI